jgi:hypothetical protein
VPAMKVTLSGAMRARDVSRPRDEQLAEAEAAEAEAANGSAPTGPRVNVGPVRAARRGAVRDDAAAAHGITFPDSTTLLWGGPGPPAARLRSLPSGGIRV